MADVISREHLQASRSLSAAQTGIQTLLLEVNEATPSFPVPNAFEVLSAQYAKRLPARLEDLAGPSQGTVDLPLQVAWSGRRSYDVEQPRSRMGLYRTVLAEGQREDLIDFLNRELLIEQWPVLRRLISRPIRHVWEAAFPELAAARTVTAA